MNPPPGNNQPEENMNAADIDSLVVIHSDYCEECKNFDKNKTNIQASILIGGLVVKLLRGMSEYCLAQSKDYLSIDDLVEKSNTACKEAINKFYDFLDDINKYSELWSPVPQLQAISSTIENLIAEQVNIQAHLVEFSRIYTTDDPNERIKYLKIRFPAGRFLRGFSDHMEQLAKSVERLHAQ